MAYSLAVIGLCVGILIVLAVIVRLLVRISRRTRPGESLWDLDRLDQPPGLHLGEFEQKPPTAGPPRP